MPTASRADRLDAFIAAATAKHDGKYDYSRVPETFVNAHTKVTIGCPDHGDFDQEPNEHKRGQRCPDCSGRRNSRASVRGARFVTRAAGIHGNRYDYSAVAFVDQHTEVTIICRRHGPFLQRPTNHLDHGGPSGCHRCAEERRPAALKDAWTKRDRSQRRDADTGEYLAA
ncbi:MULTISPECIES: hypothetical protein [unclassified Curtobacterium]|uniref:hypothetical protein n=1 Tax=unclassified Curtobacterium TaxID=257496 RepID=UPI000D96FF79|nr:MULTISPECIES: hypothetical protein [unclassified Curtobacterium]PYY34456.1 hypothetical protein DEJ32_14700 [Curtobacterium sp. MCPF17_046]PZE86851.1 hypothetical protein DEI91_00655 [Curtobacterium sp. MCBD17_032]